MKCLQHHDSLLRDGDTGEFPTVGRDATRFLEGDGRDLHGHDSQRLKVNKGFSRWRLDTVETRE